MKDLAALAEPARWAALAAVLGGWLPHQRWFQGKAREVAGVDVEDVAVIGGDPDGAVAVALARVSYVDGPAERYQVPLTVDGAPDAIGVCDGAQLRDALRDPGAARAIARCALAPAAWPSARGATIRGEPVEQGVALPSAARPLGVEQSNSSVVFGDTLLLKVFRKLEPGMNPEVELTRALTEQGFDHVPPQLGSVVLEADEGSSALAVLTAFRGGAREGWDLAVAEAQAVRSGGDVEPLGGHAGELGEVVGRMHLVLRDAFGHRRAGEGDLRGWANAMSAQAETVLATAARRAAEAAAPVLARRDELTAALGRVAVLGDAGCVIRHHGDLHLGQVLLDERHGWQVLDFEGEPARGLAERRAPHSPLRDVAGMLRSFDYAAAHGDVNRRGGRGPGLTAWHERLRAAFLGRYLAACEGEGLLPAQGRDTEALLTAFELDKAVYELGYELANRPAWVAIPVGGIERLLGPGTTDDKA